MSHQRGTQLGFLPAVDWNEGTHTQAVKVAELGESTTFRSTKFGLISVRVANFHTNRTPFHTKVYTISYQNDSLRLELRGRLWAHTLTRQMLLSPAGHLPALQLKNTGRFTFYNFALNSPMNQEWCTVNWTNEYENHVAVASI